MSEDNEVTQGRRRSSFAGLMFVLVVLVAIVVSVVAVSKWRSRGLVYSIEFKDAKGLQVGDKVELSGYPIGQVVEIRLLDSGKVLVSVQIEDKHADKVKEDSTAVIASRTFPNVSGQKVVEIHNPAVEKGKSIQKGAKIQGKDSMLNLKAWQLHGKFGNLGKSASSAARSASETISDFIEELKDIPESPEVKKATERLKTLSEEMREKGKAGLEDIRREWEQFSEHIGPAIEELKKSGKEKSAERLNSLLDSFEKKKQELLKRLNRPSAPASQPDSGGASI